MSATRTTTPRPASVIRYERWRGLGKLIAVRLCGERITGYYLAAPGEELVWRDLPLLGYYPQVLALEPVDKFEQALQMLGWIEHNRACFIADPPEGD